MGDLAVLEEFLAEPSEAVIGASDNVVNFPAPNIPGTEATNPVKDSPVTVNPGEKVNDAVKNAKTDKTTLEKAIQGKKDTEKLLGAAVPTLDDFPVPTGGIGLLVFLALLIVFAFKPLEKGGTRLSLIWQAILGNKTMGSDGSSSGGGQGASSYDTTPGINGTPNFTPLQPAVFKGTPYLQGGGIY